MLGDLRRRFGTIQECIILPFPPPSIRGLGFRSGFQMQVEDRARRRTCRAAAGDPGHHGRRRHAEGDCRPQQHVSARCSAAVRRRGPREGEDARRAAGQRLQHAAGLSGLDLRQRLQPVSAAPTRCASSRKPPFAPSRATSSDWRCAMRAGRWFRSARWPPCAAVSARKSSTATTCIPPLPLPASRPPGSAPVACWRSWRPLPSRSCPIRWDTTGPA